MSDTQAYIVYNKDNVPDAEDDQWSLYQKVALIRAMKIPFPFKVQTSHETENEPFFCEDGYLAVDARGYPYAIATEEFEKIYRIVGTKE